MANDHGHSHEHDHAHDHGDGHEDPAIDPVQLRVRALETILVEKGYIESAALVTRNSMIGTALPGLGGGKTNE